MTLALKNTGDQKVEKVYVAVGEVGMFGVGLKEVEVGIEPQGEKEF